MSEKVVKKTVGWGRGKFAEKTEETENMREYKRHAAVRADAEDGTEGGGIYRGMRWMEGKEIGRG